MAVIPSHPEGPAPRSLAEGLAQGPLPLFVALRFANDLAVELRELHQQSRAYGNLTSHSILLTDGGARLAPLRTYWDKASPDGDTHAFGLVFYQMLHGNAPPANLTAADIRMHPSQSGVARVRATSTKLALRCMSPKGSRTSMQQVATEIRLLTVMQRQEDANARSLPEDLFADDPPSMAQPSGRRAPNTWTPPIGMLINTPGAVPLPPPAPIDQINEAQRSNVTMSESAAPVVQLGPTSFGAPKPKAPAKEAPAGGSCPKCDCSVVYVSRARSKVEQFFERMKFPIVRCHRCYHRYIVIGRFKISKDMPVGTARKFRPSKRHK